MKSTAWAIALLISSPAFAGPPSDISIAGMASYQGVEVDDPNQLSDAFDGLMRDLGIAIANKPAWPAETTGANGFDFSLGTTILFLEQSDDAQSPTHWQRANSEQDQDAFLYIPSVTARKGLPLSIELGATASWMSGSQMGVFGGFARAALVEGYKPWPDLTVQIGYSGYIGHPELELGVLDIGVTLGSTYAFGSIPGIHQAQVSPWINVMFLQMFTAVNADVETRAALFGELEEDAEVDKRGRRSYGPIPQMGLGAQVTSSTVLFRIAGTWTPQAVPSLYVGIGFSY